MFLCTCTDGLGACIWTWRASKPNPQSRGQAAHLAAALALLLRARRELDLELVALQRAVRRAHLRVGAVIFNACCSLHVLA